MLVVFVYFVFFFFKQKTAYEMRISDWSSDVCSSDLENELFNGEYFIHRPDRVSGRSKLGSYNTCHIDQVYGQAWMFQVGLPRVQIGRASCRERVCQYV